MTKKSHAFFKALRVATAAVISAVMVFVLGGCSLFRSLLDDGDGSIDFTRSSITLQVGERYNLANIIDCDSTDYTLTSSDPKVVTISGSTVTAKSAGTATVKASTGYDSDVLRVTVKQKQEDSFTVETDGALVQTMGELSEITFMPTAIGSIASSSVAWYVGGRLKEMGYADEPFKYMPTGAGAFSVTAKCGEFTCSLIVRVYYPVTASVECDGELNQTAAPYSDIDFKVRVDGDGNGANPPDYIVWYDNGKIISEGSELVFSYSPAAGRHTIAAEVNGVRVYSTDAVFKGAAATPSAPTVEFDNLFPHVYVRYEVAGAAQVEITSPTGLAATFSQNSAAYKDLFDGNGFDARQVISLCASDSGRRSYRVRVKSLGDGDALTEGEYSEYYTFTQLPSAAKPYLETRCLNGDLYVTSDVEYTELVEYYVNFRSKTVNEPSVSFDCYIAYDMYDKDALWNDAFPIAATSGLYKNIKTTFKNNVMRTSFTVNTVNNPSRKSSAGMFGEGYSKQLHAVLPHINYDENKYRPDSHVFPIDEREYSAAVEYSDELYLAAERGVKPLPQSGSSAETLYELARAALREICSDDMTDMQKAHAIYDWIMWRVTYDTPATEVSSGGEKYSAYYLEGVLGDGSTSIGGVVYPPYAVCDGMSKAYALMCNIEGIPCVRVVGEAGSSIYDLGGHAWNKVFIDGAWYVVDCTWGDSQGSLTLDGNKSSVYELGLHDYLFVTDSDISSTHYEPYMNDESSIVYAPATARRKLNVYKDMTFNDAVIDCYIAGGQNERERMREIARNVAKAYKSRSSVRIAGGVNGGQYAINYQGVEVYSENGFTLSDSAILDVVTAAVNAENSSLTVKVVTYDNIMLILLK
ncbi:transglutaminase domain-containing protein [Anaerocaecibacter muris]|uniref:transglutaminase domain-containing protein n=1 Tax=Anaerocaecibacter muris TaxID=2941513 RepID=UPI003F68C9E5